MNRLVLPSLICVFLSAALPSPSQGQAGLQALLLTDSSGIDDKAFNALAWKGITEFFGDSPEAPVQRGRVYDWRQCQDYHRSIQLLEQASSEEVGLIVLPGFLWADSLEAVAPRHPDQAYLILDVDWLENPQVLQFSFREDEGSFLAGAAIALKAREEGREDACFGFIGGVPGPMITSFEMGYVQGILSILPKARFVDYYAYDWARPGLARTQARAWYESGVYAVYCAAGGTAAGALEAAREARKAGLGAWYIGVDSDQFEEGLFAPGESVVFCSMVKRLDLATGLALEALSQGSLGSRRRRLGAGLGMVDVTRTNPALGPDIGQALEAIKAEFASGRLRVEVDYGKAVQAGLAPAGLKAWR